LPDLYDDGGYSGGNMARPGLEQLMADVAAGRVDIIVVYKVDRLTRSLADFAKIVDVLDRAEASFVSVTQAFNTTTSMGRLTLNVLLSFAQFEREVTSERIRDKVAASKAKGMWMGGPVPLSYDVLDRKLVVNEAEAATVRHIFERYQVLRSIGRLVEEMEEQGVRTKQRVFRDGRTIGGIAYTKGPLAWLLANRTYVGEVGHRGKIYPGEHEAIISRDLWDDVQETIANNRISHRMGSRAKMPSLLTGLLRDGQDRPMSPTCAVRGARRCRYFATRAAAAGIRDVENRLRIPSAIIGDFVLAQLACWFERQMPGPDMAALDADKLRARAGSIATLLRDGLQSEKRAALFDLDVGVAIHPESVVITFLGTSCETDNHVRLEVQATFVDRGSDLRLAIGPDGSTGRIEPDRVLLKLVALGSAAREQILTGAPDPLIDGYSPQHQMRLARVGYLAPDIITAIVEGRQPPSLNGRRLLRATDLPLAWDAQRSALGFA
jgi:site-specific DNA recombinase